MPPSVVFQPTVESSTGPVKVRSAFRFGLQAPGGGFIQQPCGFLGLTFETLALLALARFAADAGANQAATDGQRQNQTEPDRQ